MFRWSGEEEEWRKPDSQDICAGVESVGGGCLQRRTAQEHTGASALGPGAFSVISKSHYLEGHGWLTYSLVT